MALLLQLAVPWELIRACAELIRAYSVLREPIVTWPLHAAAPNSRRIMCNPHRARYCAADGRGSSRCEGIHTSYDGRYLRPRR